MAADDGQPGGRACVALAEDDQALAAGLAVEAFELQHRQVEAAGQAQASPGQAGQQLRLEQTGQGLECLLEGRCGAKQGTRQDVQRQAFVQRLEPPEQQHGQARLLPEQRAAEDKHRQGQ